MAAVSRSHYSLSRGDTWQFGPFQHFNPDNSPIDMTGCTIFAAVEWTGGRVDMIDEIDADEQATGFYWIDQAQGSFAFRIKGRSAQGETDSDNESVPSRANFVYRTFDSLGALQTEIIKPIEVSFL